MVDFNKEDIFLDRCQNLFQNKNMLQETRPSAVQHYHSISSFKEKAKICAVSLMIFKDGNTWKLVFMQRPDYDGVHGGQICFPGGKKEDYENLLEETAIRETLEEVGVSIKTSHILGGLSELYIMVSNALVYPFVAYLPNRPVYTLEKKEVRKIIEIDINWLLEPKNKNLKTYTYKQMAYKMPVFCFENHEIWGATALILEQFLNIWKIL